MHVIELQAPQVSGTEARFAWTVTPETDLYHRSAFTLRFPATVELGSVTDEIWWRIALLCLHTHWALLRTVPGDPSRPAGRRRDRDLAAHGRRRDRVDRARRP